jgi:hypothetical protein
MRAGSLTQNVDKIKELLSRPTPLAFRNVL